MNVGIDFAGSVGSVGILPTSSYVVDVLFDSVLAGTITVDVAGVTTFATVATSAQTISIGTRVQFRGPSTPDGTVSGLSFTIFGDLI